MKIKCSFRHELKGIKRYYVCEVTEAVIADHSKIIKQFVGEHVPGKLHQHLLL